MNKSIIKSGLILITFGLSFFINIAVAQNGGQFVEAKDAVRLLTHKTRLRNSEIDQWKYLTDLKDSFERNIIAVETNQVLVKELRAYCASDSDSYTCNSGGLVSSVDDKMNLIVKDWRNAVLNIIAIEKNRNGDSSGNLRFKQLNEYNVLMRDIERLNERAKVNYNLASRELIEFQELNPLLFTLPTS